MRFLARNIVALFILQGSVYLVPLITTPYLARVLGVENCSSCVVLIVYNYINVIFGKFWCGKVLDECIAIVPPNFDSPATIHRREILMRCKKNYRQLHRTKLHQRITTTIFCFILYVMLVLEYKVSLLLVS